MNPANVDAIHAFLDAVAACKGEVYLKSREGDVFNLKSSLSQYIAIGKLLEESGNAVVLSADDPREERLLQALLEKLSH